VYTYLAVVRTADHGHGIRGRALDHHLVATRVPGRRQQPAPDLRLFGVHPFRGPQFQFLFVVRVVVPATVAATELAFNPLGYVQRFALVARAALGHPVASFVHQRLGKRLETKTRARAAVPHGRAPAGGGGGVFSCRTTGSDGIP